MISLFNRLRNIIGVFSIFINDWRNNDDIFDQQTWQTIPHVIDLINLLNLLYINWINRCVLDELKTYNFLAGVNTLSNYHFHVIAWDNAYSMGTSYRAISNEVSIKNKKVFI